MRRTRSSALFTAALVAGVVAGLAGPASAGPPLICHPVEIGDAESLPWGDGAFDTARGFGAKEAVERTLELLAPETPVFVRMETIRRASIYLKGDERRSAELLAALTGRALDAEASGRPSADAWFDAGYLVQTYHQRSRDDAARWRMGTAAGVAGYAWAKRAIQLDGENPAFQLGAALMTAMSREPVARPHLEKAEAARSRDPLLAANLRAHAPSIREFSAQFGRR